MAQAKDHINKLKQQISCLKQSYELEKERDWGNCEMACITIAIFGGNLYNYIESCKHELISKINELIYQFQNDIYLMFLKGILNKKEYEYCYYKSKEMLL